MAHLKYFDQRNMVLKAMRNIQLTNVLTSVVLETMLLVKFCFTKIWI